MRSPRTAAAAAISFAAMATIVTSAFAQPKPSAAPLPKAKPTDASPTAGAVAEVNRDAVTQIKPAAAAWSYPPTTPTTSPALVARISGKPIPISNLDAANEVHTRSGGVDVCGSTAMFVYTTLFPNKPTSLEIIDCANARITFRGEFPDSSVACSVTPFGRRVVGKGGKTSPRVDVWDMPTAGISAAAAAKPKLVVSFIPYAPEPNGNETPATAALAVDADHLITANGTGTIMGVKVAPNSATAVWQCSLDASRLSDDSIALSPDRRTVAVGGNGAITLFDSLTGEVRGAIETNAGTLSSLVFRGDGKRLAGMRGSTLYVFDLVAGKQIASICMSGPLTRRPPAADAPADTRPPTLGDESAIHWIGGDVIFLTSTGVAFNVKDDTVLGVYRLPGEKGIATVGDRLIASIKPTVDRNASHNAFANNGPIAGSRVLGSWDLASLTPANARVAAPTPLPVVTHGAGTSVSIDIGNLSADAATKNAILESLRRQLHGRNWTESPDARIKIVGRSEDGRSEQRTYQNISPGGASDVTVTEKISRLVIEIDGKPVWEARNASMAGSFVQLKPGQSMQDAVNAQSQGSALSLKNAALPEVLFEPMDTLPSGTPTFDLTPTGAQVAQ